MMAKSITACIDKRIDFLRKVCYNGIIMPKATKKNTSRTPRPSSVSRRPALTLLFLVLFLGAVFAVIMIAKSINNTTNDDKSQESPAQTTDTKKEQDSSEGTTDPADPLGEQKNSGKTPVQNAGDDPNDKDALTGVITYAERQDDTLRIRVNIDQNLGTSGTCALKITQNGQTVYTASAATDTVASASTCHEAFDVPAAGWSGAYDITITVTAGEKAGTIERSLTL